MHTQSLWTIITAVLAFAAAVLLTWVTPYSFENTSQWVAWTLVASAIALVVLASLGKVLTAAPDWLFSAIYGAPMLLVIAGLLYTGPLEEHARNVQLAYYAVLTCGVFGSCVLAAWHDASTQEPLSTRHVVYEILGYGMMYGSFYVSIVYYRIAEGIPLLRPGDQHAMEPLAALTLMIVGMAFSFRFARPKTDQFWLQYAGNWG